MLPDNSYAQSDGSSHHAPPSYGIPIETWLPLAVFLCAGLLVLAVSSWRLFTKAGDPGWVSLVPVVNVVTVLRYAGRPWWWMFLLPIPFVGAIAAVVAAVGVARAFGKGAAFGFGLLLLPPVFVPILAFGSATWRGDPRRA